MRLGPPDKVASQQAAWDRGQQILRLRAAGMTYTSIAKAMGLSPCRVRQIAIRGKTTAPIEVWLAANLTPYDFAKALIGEKDADWLMRQPKRVKLQARGRLQQWAREYTDWLNVGAR